MQDEIGTSLVLDHEELRVWHLRLSPGAQFPLHRHRHSYVWTSLTTGEALVVDETGEKEEVSFEIGDSAYQKLAPGTSLSHSIENIGKTELLFVAVEIKEAG